MAQPACRVHPRTNPWSFPDPRLESENAANGEAAWHGSSTITVVICIDPFVNTVCMRVWPNGSGPLKLRPLLPPTSVGARFGRMRRLHGGLLGGALAHYRPGRI